MALAFYAYVVIYRRQAAKNVVHRLKCYLLVYISSTAITKIGFERLLLMLRNKCVGLIFAYFAYLNESSTHTKSTFI